MWFHLIYPRNEIPVYVGTIILCQFESIQASFVLSFFLSSEGLEETLPTRLSYVGHAVLIEILKTHFAADINHINYVFVQL